MKRNESTKPILEEIRRLIECSHLSQRRVEKRAGFSKGYLSQLLAQNLDLKVWHLLSVLEILGSHPGAFFQRLYPVRHQTAMDRFATASQPLTEDLDEVLGRLYSGGFESLSELRRRVARCEAAVAHLETVGSLGSISEPRKG